MKNAQNTLSTYANINLSYSVEETDAGECVSFSIEIFLSVVMGACQLNDICKERSLVFAITSDRAKINNNLYQLIVGFKVAYSGTVEPLTNRAVESQTRNACWPVRIVLGHETTSMRTNHKNHIGNWWDR